jgi:hypothetical protein
MSPRRHQVHARRQPVYKAGACRNEIEAPRPARADLVLDQARSRGKHVVGRDRADNDRVHFRGVDTALSQRAPRRLNSHIGSGHIGIRNVPLPDSCALEYPLIAGFDEFLQVLVRE